MQGLSNNHLNDYNNLNHRLKKKRILKLSNIHEAGDRYEFLGAKCEGENEKQTAAMCYRAAAKCAISLGYNRHSSSLQAMAARLFTECEIQLRNNKFVSTEENLQAALHCWNEARNRWAESDGLMAAIISLELGMKLATLGKHEAALSEMQRAALWFKRPSIERVECLVQILSLQIQIQEFEEALVTCSNAIEECKCLPETGHRRGVLRQLQVDRILLLLIVEPVTSQLSKEELSVLEGLTWAENISNEEGNIDCSPPQIHNSCQDLLNSNPDLFFLLQSTVMASQAVDVYNLAQLESQMQTHLTLQQKQLMRYLVKNINKTNK